jgi:competence protein ComEA
MERRRRFVLWLITAGLAITLFPRGHGIPPEGVTVAFLRYTSTQGIIRVKGQVPAPGVYRLPVNADLDAVIKMTSPRLVRKVLDKGLLKTKMKSGDIVEVAARDKKNVDITIGKMKAKERMLLGIPLHPDQMDMADWDSLPGIGPGLARNIMDDRHKNGDFGSIESLQRVPGIGEKKLKEIIRFF